MNDNQFESDRLGIGFWAVMLLLCGGIACCAWLVLLGIDAGDSSGPWLFAAFGFMFSIFFIFGVLRLISVGNPRIKSFYDKAVKSDRIPDTRFVPHWYMLLATLILIASVLYGIAMGIMSFIRD
jgi:hypothetical protein